MEFFLSSQMLLMLNVHVCISVSASSSLRGTKWIGKGRQQFARTHVRHAAA